MLHVSLVPYIKELIVKKFNNNFNHFLFTLNSNPQLFYLNYVANNTPLYYGLLLHHNIPPLSIISKKEVTDGKDSYATRVNGKQSLQDFENKDDQVFSHYQKKHFINEINKVINNTNPVVAIRFRRSKNNKYGKIKLILDNWYSGKTDSSTIEEATNYKDSLEKYQPKDGKGRNLGVCQKVIKNSQDEINDFNAWLNKFFVVHDNFGNPDVNKSNNLTVYMHLIFDGELINVVFSNMADISKRSGFEELVEKYATNSPIKKEILKKLDETFPETYFNKGQYCCPPPPEA